MQKYRLTRGEAQFNNGRRGRSWKYKVRLGIAATMAVMAQTGSAHDGSHAGHSHGIVTVTVAQDGEKVVVELMIPGRDAVGFERRPITAAETEKVESAIEQLRDDTRVMRWLPAGICSLRAVDSMYEALTSRGDDGGAEGGEQIDTIPVPSAPTSHADVYSRYDYTCRDHARLESIELKVFELFPSLKGAYVQTAIDGAFSESTLTPVANRIGLK